MIKVFYSILVSIFLISVAYTKPITCSFEEVYENGEQQQGYFFFQNNKIRYEYLNKNLYTILFINNNFYLIENLDRKKIQLVPENNTAFPILSEIFLSFPNLKQTYKNKDYEVNIEESSNIFLKRVVIKSIDMNVSIYFINCNNDNLNEGLFNFNPFLEYVHN